MCGAIALAKKVFQNYVKMRLQNLSITTDSVDFSELDSFVNTLVALGLAIGGILFLMGAIGVVGASYCNNICLNLVSVANSEEVLRLFCCIPFVSCALFLPSPAFSCTFRLPDCYHVTCLPTSWLRHPSSLLPSCLLPSCSPRTPVWQGNMFPFYKNVSFP